MDKRTGFKLVVGRKLVKKHKWPLCTSIYGLTTGNYWEKGVFLIALDMAGALLYAEVKLGELLKGIDKKESYTGLTSTGGRKPTLPEGISHKLSHYSQVLAQHKDIVEETIAKADEDGGTAEGVS